MWSVSGTNVYFHDLQYFRGKPDRESQRKKREIPGHVAEGLWDTRDNRHALDARGNGGEEAANFEISGMKSARLHTNWPVIPSGFSRDGNILSATILYCDDYVEFMVLVAFSWVCDLCLPQTAWNESSWWRFGEEKRTYKWRMCKGGWKLHTYANSDTFEFILLYVQNKSLCLLTLKQGGIWLKPKQWFSSFHLSSKVVCT